ncbi:MAG: amino acid ABC transporter permease [Geminicoccales bacterium]
MITSRQTPVLATRHPTVHRHGLDLLLFMLGSGLVAWLVYLGATSMGYNWQWYRVPRYLYRVIDGELIWGPLIKGLLVTLQITFWSALLALAIGLTTALLRLSRSASGYFLATAYLELVRNTPLLVQMFLFYFVLAPIFGIERFWTGVICLAFFEAAFISEIIRGGILSVSKGQWEAAASVGLTSSDVYRKVILPQAVPIMLPTLTSAIVNLIKNSAIVSTIAIFDLTTEGRNVIADTFMSFEIWFTVAGIYLVLTLSLSGIVDIMERRVRETEIR